MTVRRPPSARCQTCQKCALFCNAVTRQRSAIALLQQPFRYFTPRAQCKTQPNSTRLNELSNAILLSDAPLRKPCPWLCAARANKQTNEQFATRGASCALCALRANIDRVVPLSVACKFKPSVLGLQCACERKRQHWHMCASLRRRSLRSAALHCVVSSLSLSL